MVQLRRNESVTVPGWHQNAYGIVPGTGHLLVQRFPNLPLWLDDVRRGGVAGFRCARDH